ncbi:MAG: NUDIX hydrolase [Nanoarchaeota archaeon]
MKDSKGRLILVSCLVVNDKKEVLLLFRKDHKHYETPGGKVHEEEFKDQKNPTNEELMKVAERELGEELGEDIKIEKLKFFVKIDFEIPDGRLATTSKFITKYISGEPIIQEPELFEKFDWLPIKSLEKYPIAPDMKLFLKRFKEYAKN